MTDYSQSPTAKDAAKPANDFSPVLGGPLYQFYLRFRLARPPLELLHRRIVAVVLITWVPLAVLSLFEGRAFGGVNTPFFEHLSVHARFLLSLPLMVLAENIVHSRISTVIGEFASHGLISPNDHGRFGAILASSSKLRNSVVIEVILILAAWTLGYKVWREIAIGGTVWYATADGSYNLAGYWYAFVSLPLFRFFLARWYFRLLVWYRFLWKVSRLPLRLDALHPDRAGGLGFLAATPVAFLPVLLAQTCLLAGKIGDHIWHDAAKLPQFKMEIIALLLILVTLAYFPLLFFAPRLAQVRRAGLRAYGAVAMRYVVSFREKWITAAPTEGGESLLGSADIQSLADLGNSFQVLRETNMMPFGQKSVLSLAIMLALPLLPLLLTMIPLSEIIDRLFKMVV